MVSQIFRRSSFVIYFMASLFLLKTFDILGFLSVIFIIMLQCQMFTLPFLGTEFIAHIFHRNKIFFRRYVVNMYFFIFTMHYNII